MPVLPGPPPVEITLRRSARARRFSLRVSQLDGRVTLTVPPRAREAEAMVFARAQEGWLRAALARLPVQAGVGIGSAIPVEGRVLTLVQATGRGVRVVADRLEVGGDPAQAGARVGAWLRVLARERLLAASDHYAGLLGLRFARVTLRDTRSRWGSCSANGALMYSWRLIMAPSSVLAYVAAHEVAHLAQMNHSPAFWAVVQGVYPDWQVPRGWLHSHGPGLHGLRFEA